MLKPGTILRLSDNTLVEVRKDPTWKCKRCVFSEHPRGKLNPEGISCKKARNKYLDYPLINTLICMVPDGYSFQEIKGGV
jgi:hypothetical protein